jgi:hypothetical protein
MTQRERVLGRGLFEVFPDNLDDPTATGTRNLRASLERVLRDKVPGTMSVQKHSIRKPMNFSEFIETVRRLGLYWLILNERPPARRG